MYIYIYNTYIHTYIHTHIHTQIYIYTMAGLKRTVGLNLFRADAELCWVR